MTEKKNGAPKMKKEPPPPKLPTVHGFIGGVPAEQVLANRRKHVG